MNTDQHGLDKRGSPLFDRVVTILEDARTRVSRTVNSAMVIAYWLIGREIVEEEQKGKRRAEYGKALIADLSRRLRERYGRGFSVPNVRNFRQFYLVYRQRVPKIRYPVGGESKPGKRYPAGSELQKGGKLRPSGGESDETEKGRPTGGEFQGFDEREHGAKIVPLLNLDHILDRPETCAFLRSLFGWCVGRLTESADLWDNQLTTRYQLETGRQEAATKNLAAT